MSYALDCRTLQSTPANTALEHGITLKVVKLSEAKRGFVLLPRRWMVERSFDWAARFRRLAFACLRLHHLPEAMNVIENML